MRGYFISTTIVRKYQNTDSNISQRVAHVHPLTYCVDPEDEYVSGGMWKPSCLEDRRDRVILKTYPGYHLTFNKLSNANFEQFCQNKEVSCNGWMETETYSPYKVKGFNKNMFLLLAMNLETNPMDVSEETLQSVLQKYKIIYN